MKKVIMFAIIVSVVTAIAAGSAGNIQELETVLEKILEIVQGNVTRLVLAIVLAALFIGMALNTQNPDMQKKLLVFAIATAGLLAASSIMVFIFDDAGAILQ